MVFAFNKMNSDKVHSISTTIILWRKKQYLHTEKYVGKCSRLFHGLYIHVAHVIEDSGTSV